MRIIGGVHKGRVLKVPSGLPVRPTTDFAKEGLFNILNSRYDLTEMRVLDLFSGTGHISLEFASRGAINVLAVDQNFKCVGFLKSTAQDLSLPISVIKSDVFDFLKKATQKFDLIFADPPYDHDEILKLPDVVFSKQLLNPGGVLVVEHGPRTKFDEKSGFAFHRKYGNVNFSFFQEKEN